jgi:DNA-binding CsgD family transcriptional regulator
MVSLEAFSELLEVLYSAPLQDSEWQRFLALLSHHTQSQLSIFLCADSRIGLSIRAQGGSSELESLDVLAYNERYAASDPFRAPALRDTHPRIVQDEDLLPNAGLLQTDLYRDILAPRDSRYATLLLLTTQLRRLECISIWRTTDQGPMDEDCQRLLHLLFPHIKRALEIRHLLGITQERLAGAEAMADASATPTLLLTRNGRVLHGNAAAQSLLHQSKALTLHNGTLIPTQARFKEPLRKLFSDAASPISPHWMAMPTHAFSLPRTADLQPLQLLASPLPPAHRSSSNADLVLLITDPEQTANFPDAILHSLYNLTPAQTEVTNGLLTGYTLEEIAILRHVSLGTVRQQLKTILHKTNTTRQSDLVRLLMSLPPSASAN